MRYLAIILLSLFCAGCQDPDMDAKGLEEGVEALLACQQGISGSRFDGRKLSAEKWKAEHKETTQSPAAVSESYVWIKNYRVIRFYQPTNPADVANCSATMSFATQQGQGKLRSNINSKLGQAPSKVEDSTGGGDGLSNSKVGVTIYTWDMPDYSVELRQQSDLISHLSLNLQNSEKSVARVKRLGA
jgi:hypothetical protein